MALSLDDPRRAIVGPAQRGNRSSRAGRDQAAASAAISTWLLLLVSKSASDFDNSLRIIGNIRRPIKTILGVNVIDMVILLRLVPNGLNSITELASLIGTVKFVDVNLKAFFGDVGGDAFQQMVFAIRQITAPFGTHATVDRHLRALERAYCVRLFERSSAGLSLNPAGDELLPMAEAAERL